jgi:hypothetical protein
MVASTRGTVLNLSLAYLYVLGSWERLFEMNLTNKCLETQLPAMFSKQQIPLPKRAQSDEVSLLAAKNRRIEKSRKPKSPANKCKDIEEPRRKTAGAKSRLTDDGNKLLDS